MVDQPSVRCQEHGRKVRTMDRFNIQSPSIRKTTFLQSSPTFKILLEVEGPDIHSTILWRNNSALSNNTKHTGESDRKPRLLI